MFKNIKKQFNNVIMYLVEILILSVDSNHKMVQCYVAEI